MKRGQGSNARQRRAPTLAGQFLFLQLIVIAVVLVAVAVVSFRQADNEFREVRGSRMVAVASNLANTPLVRDTVCGADCQPVSIDEDPGKAAENNSVISSEDLAFAVDRAVSLSGASIAYLTDQEGTILTSSDPTTVGTKIDLRTSDVLTGRAWRGNVDERGVRAIAGQVPLLNDDGKLIGIAAVAEEYPSVSAQLRNATPNLGLFLGIGAALGGFGAWLLARLIKRRTRGLEPTEIAALADNREALLHSIREGVIAVNSDGVITVVNESATDLLSLATGVVGSQVAALDLGDEVKRVLLDQSDTRDSLLLVGERLVVLNRNSVIHGTRQVGTVTTLRDRTELIAMQSQLDAHQSITETLRAQTHEFANQLHTISGLVELEEYDEVAALIGNLTRRRAEIADAITAVVEDPTVAALLIAKTSLAAEAGVMIELAPGSGLSRSERELSTDVATVLGNLIDNAIDASSGAVRRLVGIRIAEETDAVVLEISDSGAGVPTNLTDAIFGRGFSTKPTVPGGRGVGLALVHLVCTRRGGTIAVHNDGGAVFRATLPYSKALHDQRPHR